MLYYPMILFDIIILLYWHCISSRPQLSLSVTNQKRASSSEISP